MANRHTITDLYQMQALPLSAKVRMTERRIDDWVSEFGEDGVYLSFSGGKDSTVLVDIVRNVCGYRNISLVFVDVPTQYPELKQFAQTFDNLEILKPKISFAEVCWCDDITGFGICTHKYKNSDVRGSADGDVDLIEDFDSSKWEVIGNIFDNPELLESEEQYDRE